MSKIGLKENCKNVKEEEDDTFKFNNTLIGPKNSDYLNNQFYTNFLNIFSKICIFNIFLQIITDLSIRSHYIIDEVTGLLVAHFCIMEFDFISDFMDVKIPLIKRRLIKEDFFRDEIDNNSQNLEKYFLDLNRKSSKDSKNSDSHVEVVSDIYF
jgi:hypothetical protein